MIFGLGNDIIEINRIEKAISKEGFKEKVFTGKELKLIISKGNKAETYAGRFSAKEAISKAFGTGVRGFKLLDIEILEDELGKPIVFLKNNLLLKYKDFNLSVSISHSKEYATAVAIVEK